MQVSIKNSNILLVLHDPYHFESGGYFPVKMFMPLHNWISLVLRKKEAMLPTKFVFLFLV